MQHKALGNKPHITSRNDMFLGLSLGISLKQQKKPGKKTKQSSLGYCAVGEPRCCGKAV